MAVKEITVDEKLCQFIKEYGNDRCSLELLRFLGRHPHARFCRLAIVPALSARSLDMQEALRHLMDKGLVTEYAANGVHFYSLTEDESLRSLALGLAALDWHQWQLMLEQTRRHNEVGY
jgi:hypothetical protein